jgi:hypothetical protein
MRVLLSTWGSRGDIEPLAALALRLRELGAEVRAWQTINARASSIRRTKVRAVVPGANPGSSSTCGRVFGRVGAQGTLPRPVAPVRPDGATVAARRPLESR